MLSSGPGPRSRLRLGLSAPMAMPMPGLYPGVMVRTRAPSLPPSPSPSSAAAAQRPSSEPNTPHNRRPSTPPGPILEKLGGARPRSRAKNDNKNAALPPKRPPLMKPSAGPVRGLWAAGVDFWLKRQGESCGRRAVAPAEGEVWSGSRAPGLRPRLIGVAGVRRPDRGDGLVMSREVLVVVQRLGLRRGRLSRLLGTNWSYLTVLLNGPNKFLRRELSEKLWWLLETEEGRRCFRWLRGNRRSVTWRLEQTVCVVEEEGGDRLLKERRDKVRADRRELLAALRAVPGLERELSAKITHLIWRHRRAAEIKANAVGAQTVPMVDYGLNGEETGARGREAGEAGGGQQAG